MKLWVIIDRMCAANAVQIYVTQLLCPQNLGAVIHYSAVPPNYLLHENRTLYHQHIQIITEVDVKLNKWHITIEKLYRKHTDTEQFFFKL